MATASGTEEAGDRAAGTGKFPQEGMVRHHASAAAGLHFAQAPNSTSHDAGHPTPSSSPALGWGCFGASAKCNSGGRSIGSLPPLQAIWETQNILGGLPYTPLCQGIHTPFEIRAPQPLLWGWGAFPVECLAELQICIKMLCFYAWFGELLPGQVPLRSCSSEHVSMAGWLAHSRLGGELVALKTGERSLMLLPAQLLAGLALQEGREQCQ